MEPVEPAEPEVPPTPPDPPEDVITELSTGLSLTLRPKDVNAIWSASNDYAQQERLVTDFLDLETSFPSQEQRGIVCDFHLFNLIHASSLCLSTLQGAVFHVIMATILAMMRSADVDQGSHPPKFNGISICFQKFEELLVRHSISEPPDRLDIFRGTEARMLTDFATQTLFKHFLLYQSCINFEREVQTLRFTLAVERPFHAPDLGAAQHKPKRKVQPAGVVEAGEFGEDLRARGIGEVADADDDGEDEHDEDVERLVSEKLREYEAQWENMLAEREDNLKQRQKLLSERQQALPKTKAKK